ncbi:MULTISPECIES: hypothetical protein [unclassified Arthrobacter]|uniref:hypothetical protein n=1 Tax=unclassified Arthrobacter TaxID=235627 RepID=UPI002DF7B457|nr:MULTISPECIES: hypothetical protein [unclassified Arthrobacter]MEC5193025.1 hypothetical protein [Arthrobacter sp. MP_M4]MEC5204555.1 hypothetical protein [Arthrobacter sp. MP_M7]
MTRYIHELDQRPAASLDGAQQAVPKNRTGYVYFAKHLGVMVALMYGGMFVLDPVYEMTVALAGVDDPWVRLPVLSNIIMAFNMSVPMVLYMRHRRHTWQAIAEMSAAMLLPAALTTVPYLLGVMTAGTMISLSHATMIPLMAVAMMLRFREYAGHKPGYRLPATAQESGL